MLVLLKSTSQFFFHISNFFLILKNLIKVTIFKTYLAIS